MSAVGAHSPPHNLEIPMPTTPVVRTGLPVHPIDLDVLRAFDIGALHTALRSLRMAVRHIGEDIQRVSSSATPTPFAGFAQRHGGHLR